MFGYDDLHRAARLENDSLAVTAATCARDLYRVGARAEAANHAKLARKRLIECALERHLAALSDTEGLDTVRAALSAMGGPL